MTTVNCDDPEIGILVSGFIRNTQKSLNQVVPVAINHVCVKFYYSCEQFMKCGSSMELRNDGRAVTFTKESFWDNTAHGMAKINGNSAKGYVYCWKFKIMKYAVGISIGITSSKDINVEQAVNDVIAQDEHYMFAADGKQYDLNHKTGHRLMDKSGFNPGDFVTMIVEPSRKAMRYLVSDDHANESIHALFTNIDFKHKIFKMAVSIGYPQSGIELVQFTKTSTK